MLNRLGLIMMAAVAMFAVGCGTNSGSGLKDIELKPDLTPVDVEDQQPTTPYLEGTVTFKTSISNKGGIPSRDFQVRGTLHWFNPNTLMWVFVNETTVDVPGLEAGDAVAVTHSFSLPAKSSGRIGAWRLTVWADPEDTIDESNEGNNTHAHFFNVVMDGNEGEDPITIQPTNN